MPTPNVLTAAPMSDTISVVLSAGIEQVLQLDDNHPDSYRGGGVTIERAGKGRIRVGGSREAMEHFAAHCTAAQHYCGAAWYGRSAAAALKTVRAALDGEG